MIWGLKKLAVSWAEIVRGRYKWSLEQTLIQAARTKLDEAFVSTREGEEVCTVDEYERDLGMAHASRLLSKTGEKDIVCDAVFVIAPTIEMSEQKRDYRIVASRNSSGSCVFSTAVMEKLDKRSGILRNTKDDWVESVKGLRRSDHVLASRRA